jgi:tetratricopeptide (TPR) repeat protein
MKDVRMLCRINVLTLFFLLFLPTLGTPKAHADQPRADGDWPSFPDSELMRYGSEEHLTRELLPLIEESDEYFRRAGAENDMEISRELYRQALLRLEWIAHEADVQNGRLLYNIGNIYYRLGELGNAILYYKRAEYYIPGDPNLRHNLRYLRSQRMDRVAENYTGMLSRALYTWRSLLSPRLKILVFAASFAAIWIFGILSILKRKRWKSLAIVISCVTVLFFLGSLIVHDLVWRVKQEGVITVKEVIARRGDGEMYESSFQEPLHDGTEFALVDERSGWYLIQLWNGSSGWIPSSSAELIHPQPKNQ